jgi:hypothetical protein
MKPIAIAKRIGRPPIENPASTFLHIRVTPRQKAAYYKSAPPLTMSKWVQAHLDRAARRLPVS